MRSFVFDEPTIGLHPADVAVLLKVFEQLLANGATVIVIEHDLDVIRSADGSSISDRAAGMQAATGGSGHARRRQSSSAEHYRSIHLISSSADVLRISPQGSFDALGLD